MRGLEDIIQQNREAADFNAKSKDLKLPVFDIHDDEAYRFVIYGPKVSPKEAHAG